MKKEKGVDNPIAVTEDEVWQFYNRQLLSLGVSFSTNKHNSTIISCSISVNRWFYNTVCYQHSKPVVRDILNSYIIYCIILTRYKILTSNFKALLLSLFLPKSIGIMFCILCTYYFSESMLTGKTQYSRFCVTHDILIVLLILNLSK